ncbi:MAG: acyl-CoA/acyl-ACP dehydrogenase [Deltaproteobacteria bacterium]|nr:acyl-CoA/acyl-ACP dehydrogenase [Deltaproteobacteria bacterium]
MDHDILRQELKKFVVKHLEPVALEADEKGVFPMEVYQAFCETGFGAVFLPEEFGGAASLKGLFIVMEELSRVSPAFALATMSSFQLFGYNICKIGTDAQKEKYLKGIVSDKKIGAWALTEPDTGSNAVGIETSAKKDGDDYIIKGSKTFITNAPIADYFIVITRTGGEGFDCASAFIVEREMKGVAVSEPFKKHGHRSSPTGQVFFDDVRVSKDQMLGQEGRGFYDMKHSLDIERVLVGPMVLGMLKGLLHKCVNYAAGRIQFGKPILTYQLIQEKIAKMRTHIELIEACNEQALVQYEQGKSLKNLATALKLHAGRASVEMGSEAMQILGGNGYMHEYGVEMFARDAKLLEIGGGTTEMMLQIMAKEAVRDVLGFVPKV